MKKFIKLFLVFFSLITLVSCKKETIDYSSMIKVNWVLNGGIFKNSTYNVVQYYPSKDGGTLIAALNMDSSGGKAALEYSGKVFKGWFLDEGLNNKFNFTTDKISSETTLYAKWSEPYNYTYGIYKQGTQASPQAVLDKYNNPIIVSVDEGETFYKNEVVKAMNLKTYMENETLKIGHTILGYYDQSNNVWNDSFTHPGGDNDLEIKVFIDYIEGLYDIVNTKEEFKKSMNHNIYLNNDIDLGGDTISWIKFEKNFKGNNHTISNFTVRFDGSSTGLKNNYEDETKDSLYVSLFGDVKNANISDVSFTNVTWNIKTTYSKVARIYFAPLASSITESKINNVSISGTLNIKQTPTSLTEESYELNNNYCYQDTNDTSIISNTTYSIAKNDTREA